MTPPSRQLSIWQKSIAFACSSCLKMTRLAQCSPVATPIRLRRALAIVACPSTSSGLVGSSIHQRLNRASSRDALDRLVDVPLLVGVDHQRAVGPDLLADQRARRRASSAGAPPTFTLKCVQPSASASRHSAANLRRRSSPSSRPTSCRRDSRSAAAPPRARAFVACLPFEDLERLVGRQRVGDVAEVDARDDLRAASCRRAASRPACARAFAWRSQTALTMAAMREVDDAFLRAEPAQLRVATRAIARTRRSRR